MRQTRRVVLGLVWLGLLASGLTARAEEKESAWDAIPADAAVVVRLKAPKATTERVAGFVDMVQPGMGNNVRTQAKMIGLAILNPTLEGVDMTKDWYMAVFAPSENRPDTTPTMLYIIPAIDVKAMEEGLGGEVKFVVHGDFGVYSQSSELVESVEEFLKGEDEGAGDEIDDKSLAAFEKGDLSAWVNVGGLTEEFADKLTEAKEKIGEQIENQPGSEGTQELSKKMISGFFDVIGDIEGLVATVVVEKQGVTIEEFVVAKDESGAAKFFAKSAPDALSMLSSLPGGQLGYMGGKFDVQTMMEWSGSLIESVEGGDEQKEAMKKMIEAMKGIKFGPFVAGMKLGDLESGLLRVSSLGQVSPVDKFKALMKQQAEDPSMVQTVEGLEMKVEYTEKAETIAGTPVDLYKMTVEQKDDAPPQAEMQKRLLDAMYGPNGMTGRYAFLKDQLVYVIGGESADMEAALASAQTPAKPGAGFAATRAKLGEKANLLFMVDLPNLVASGAKIASTAGLVPMQIDSDLIEGLELKESFTGFSAGADGATARAVTYIPVDQVKGFVKMAFAYFALQAGQQ
jgi:hypothetical protein